MTGLKQAVLAAGVALMAGTAGLPHIIVRFYTVPNVRAARYSAFWALLFIALLSNWVSNQIVKPVVTLYGTAEQIVATEDYTSEVAVKKEAQAVVNRQLKSMAAEGGSTGRITMEDEHQVFKAQADSPPCPECGSVTVRNGACYKCLNCGDTSGCS